MDIFTVALGVLLALFVLYVAFRLRRAYVNFRARQVYEYIARARRSVRYLPTEAERESAIDNLARRMKEKNS